MKRKVYLKVIFFADYEIKYIKMNLKESEGYVDKLLILESNRTHTGAPKELIFSKYLEGNEYFTEEEKKRMEYIPEMLDNETVYTTTDDKQIHINETYIRGNFIKHRKFCLNDIIISVDADEIIFNRSYPAILNRFKWYNWFGAYVYRLNCFIYKPNWYWKNCEFIAPQACRIIKYAFKYPANWRYEGKIIPEVIGAHFTWNLSAEQMFYKLKRYSHAALYKNLLSVELLQEAIDKKIYIFDPKREFDVEEIEWESNKELFPDYFADYIPLFEEDYGKSGEDYLI